MKKISRKDLQGLQQRFPVLTKEEMKYYVGGYSDGYSGGDFGDDWLNHGFYFTDSNGNTHWYRGYTQDELYNWEGTWYGGWVNGMGYVYPDTTIYGTYNRYTSDELFNWQGPWCGGYVEGLGYVGPDNDIINYDPNKLLDTGNESYNRMYHSGFDLGYKFGQSGEAWDGVLAYGTSFFAAASAGTDFGDVNYEMIYFSQGIREGYAKGKSSKNY